MRPNVYVNRYSLFKTDYSGMSVPYISISVYYLNWYLAGWIHIDILGRMDSYSYILVVFWVSTSLHTFDYS